MSQSPTSPKAPSEAGYRSEGSHGKTGSVRTQSGTSRASISITLPTSNPKELERESPVHIRSYTPDKATTPYNSLAGIQYERRYPSNGGTSPYSSGTIPPQATPTNKELTDEQITQILAARIIERAWLSFRDKQMFRLLKHSICAAEHSMTDEILRKVCPREGQLLKDKALQGKVRFRFGGVEFPPLIYFKIYLKTGNNNISVKYVSGKKMIAPATEAARDACDRMGHRLFYDQVIQDSLQHEAKRVTDEVDITTLKDYMQYLSVLDETPSYMGGRDNSWRKLSLEVLPRQTIFYDVVDFLYTRNMTPRLQETIPLLLSKPKSEDVQLLHIDIISQLRPTPLPPNPSPKSKLSMAPTQISSRRSKQAKSKIAKMRKMYENKDELGPEESAPKSTAREVSFVDQITNVPAPEYEDDDFDEEEADKLYEWTQELSYDEIMATPRLNTRTSSVNVY